LGNLIEGDDESHVDAFLGTVIFTDHGETVVMPVVTDVVHLLSDLETHDLEGLLTTDEVGDLNDSCEVVLLEELLQ
jgi:hypothetical protein